MVYILYFIFFNFYVVFYFVVVFRFALMEKWRASIIILKYSVEGGRTAAVGKNAAQQLWLISMVVAEDTAG